MTEAIPATTGVAGDYSIDPAHSRLGFVARHAMVTKVRGQFSDVEGTIHIDADEPVRSSARVTIKTASINTQQQQRDDHLRGADFFNVEQFPDIVFGTTSIEPLGDNTYRVTGDLTIREISQPVTFDAEFTGSATDPFGNERIGFEANTTVNRKDWELTWNAALETGGVLVSDKIAIELDVSAIRQG